MKYIYRAMWKVKGKKFRTEFGAVHVGSFGFVRAKQDYERVLNVVGKAKIQFAHLQRAEDTGVNKDKFFIHQIWK